MGRDKKTAYYAEVYAIIRELMRSEDVDGFIRQLKYLNEQWLEELAKDSYRRSGGAHEYDRSSGLEAAAFVNAYADNFGEAIRQGTMTEAQIERRAMMYPESGFRMAVMNGQKQAMKERGARRWRRVLGASRNGPCMECTADAEITHDIDEAFVEFHPNGVCSQQFLQFTMGEGEMPIDMPVPSDESDRIRRRRI